MCFSQIRSRHQNSARRAVTSAWLRLRASSGTVSKGGIFVSGRALIAFLSDVISFDSAAGFIFQTVLYVQLLLPARLRALRVIDGDLRGRWPCLFSAEGGGETLLLLLLPLPPPRSALSIKVPVTLPPSGSSGRRRQFRKEKIENADGR